MGQSEASQAARRVPSLWNSGCHRYPGVSMPLWAYVCAEDEDWKQRTRQVYSGVDAPSETAWLAKAQPYFRIHRQFLSALLLAVVYGNTGQRETWTRSMTMSLSKQDGVHPEPYHPIAPQMME